MFKSHLIYDVKTMNTVTKFCCYHVIVSLLIICQSNLHTYGYKQFPGINVTWRCHSVCCSILRQTTMAATSMEVILCIFTIFHISCAFPQRKVMTCFEDKKCRHFTVDSDIVRDVYVRKCLLSKVVVKGEKPVSIRDLEGKTCSK